jgi:hypothetical protein
MNWKAFAKYFARNYEKKIILGTSDAWLTIHLSHRPSDPPYYIRDWRISGQKLNSSPSMLLAPQSGQKLNSRPVWSLQLHDKIRKETKFLEMKHIVECPPSSIFYSAPNFTANWLSPQTYKKEDENAFML